MQTFLQPLPPDPSTAPCPSLQPLPPPPLKTALAPLCPHAHAEHAGGALGGAAAHEAKQLLPLDQLQGAAAPCGARAIGHAQGAAHVAARGAGAGAGGGLRGAMSLQGKECGPRGPVLLDLAWLLGPLPTPPAPAGSRGQLGGAGLGQLHGAEVGRAGGCAGRLVGGHHGIQLGVQGSVCRAVCGRRGMGEGGSAGRGRLWGGVVP